MSDLTPVLRIIDTVDGSQIQTRFFSVGPNNVNARYESVSVPGRSEPYKFYDATDFDMYSVNLQLVSLEEEGSIHTIDQVWNEYLWLKSFQYPQYGNTWLQARKPPRQIHLVIGSGYYKTGTIESPSFDWSESPLDERGKPHIIKVNFTLNVINSQPLSFEQVRAGY
jgi:hypothetical protein